MPTEISHPINTAEYRGVKITERLNCYASGDGSLSFVWASTKHPCPCTGREVTRQDVEDYLNSEEGAHYKRDGWRIWQRGPWPNGTGPDFSLIAPVKRIDDNTLEYKGNRYTVAVSERHENGEVGDYAMTVTTVVEGIGTIDVKNWSTRAALRHFLSNEKNLPPL